MNIEDTDLLKWLQRKNPGYYGKVFELRDEVRGWLNYVPATFPHFTRHTLEHSEAIIRQVSNLLFHDGKLAPGASRLSATEAFIVIAAAYLHDAGMVTSDTEKASILKSDGWQSWVAGNESIRKRLDGIDAFRRGNEPANAAERNFLADIQLRHLIAEHVRRSHHLRAGDVVQNYEVALGRFAYQDPNLRDAIATVCVGHGLDHRALEDTERFPKECDIRDDKVNMQFVAVLLRLGDLLDMGHDRACPLLLNAACPLPADSIAHWAQYERIKLRNTSPKTIEITAECETGDEHRVLQDWCQWIVDETARGLLLAAGWSRHKGWRPPHASIDASKGTIKIRPSATAKYRPSNYRFELDQDLVFERLIKDAYDSELVFIRELSQNGLDANRCQMYRDLKNNGQPTPTSPTKVPPEWLIKYPLKVSLTEREVTDSSGATTTRHIVTIEDCGIGMDEDVVSRFLLQVGRSFYTTEKFRKEYSFVPTSRFGIGFLSVFAASQHVEVETFNPDAASGALRLVLTGPRNYLLIENSSRQVRGTRVSVQLDEKLQPGQLTFVVSNWCKRVEFPIEIDDLGHRMTLQRETAQDFERPLTLPGNSDGTIEYRIRAIPFDHDGVEGELYVRTKVINGQFERWNDDHELLEILEKNPTLARVTLPGGLVCLNGIVMSDDVHANYGLSAARIDIRSSSTYVPTLSRQESIPVMRYQPVRDAWREALRNHLAGLPLDGDEVWVYRQRLAGILDLDDFWRTEESSFPLIDAQRDVPKRLCSLESAIAEPRIWLVKGEIKSSAQYTRFPVVSEDHWRLLADLFHDAFLAKRSFGLVERTDDSLIWIESIKSTTKDDGDSTERLSSQYNIFEARRFSDPTAIGTKFLAQSLQSRQLIILNSEHPLVKWFSSLVSLSANPDMSSQISKSATNLSNKVLELILSSDWPTLQERLADWRMSADFPEAFRPPDVEISDQSFW